jgi:glycine cleavage system transcriptional repressor
MPHLALSAIGRDRPGIVATVSRVLLEHGVNVEDSQMTILRGHFTIVLVLSAPDGLDRAALEADLESARAELGLGALSLSEIAEATAGHADPSHILTVYGVDHPGIVHAVSSALAERSVNITDLNTRLVEEEGGEPLYAMMIEVALPAGMEAAQLEQALEGPRREQGVEVTVRALEEDVL